MLPRTKDSVLKIEQERVALKQGFAMIRNFKDISTYKRL